MSQRRLVSLSHKTTDAIATKVRQEFTAKEKARKTPQASPKHAKRAA